MKVDKARIAEVFDEFTEAELDEIAVNIRISMNTHPSTSTCCCPAVDALVTMKQIIARRPKPE